MTADRSSPLDDPAYLRRESRRLHRIIKVLSDPEVKKGLAAHSFYLAQRAEAIDRSTEDPAAIAMQDNGYRLLPAVTTNGGERLGIN
jgi:hypothetical protein